MVTAGTGPSSAPPVNGQDTTLGGTGIDVAAARADTRGCAGVAHFNNAGASLPPRQVTDAVIAHLQSEEQIGGYEAAMAAGERSEAVHASAAALIGAHADEIAVVGSATQAWDIAFHGFRLAAGDRVLVDRARYPGHAVAMVQAAHRSGVVVELVDDDTTGQLDLADLERRLASDVRLVALTYIPTDSGLVNPIAAAGALCRAAGVPLLVDGCQAVGQLAIDVDALGCDMLTATGRKFLRGPRGTGFLYVRRDRLDDLEPPSLDMYSASWDRPDSVRMRDDARRFESFERSIATVLGLGAAIDYALGWGSTAIEQRIRSVADELRDRLAGIDGVRLDRVGVDQCGIITFTVADLDSASVQRDLAARGVNTSVTRPLPGAVAPGATLPRARVRASVHYYNDAQDLDTLIQRIEQVSVSR
ncbi:aminotransferase class V-fold PLP-dependent enzyme [Nakamurella deserti]|uniref:aminotransferase class V-fold PLP-dependent enzyme n=1 Tax=Nakamurella deserti TaxID=2164074 RepID=UPI000DBE5A3F|nr:aminotransferase class V-fold PLP-dependent enzyme [Nakamurella deserti]